MIQGQPSSMVDASERTDLYSVIKTAREGEKAKFLVARLLYVSYISDAYKNENVDIEGQLSKWIANISEEYQTLITGFLIVKGQFAVHFVEGESKILNLFLNYLHEEFKKDDSIYSTLNIIAFTEENPSRMFDAWGSDNLFLSNMTLSEVDKTEQQMQDRCWVIYSLFCQAGQKLNQKLKADKNAGKYIWRDASNEVVLSTEDLQIMANKRSTSIIEYSAMYLDDLDIELDGELEFPQKPSLIDILEYEDKKQE